MRARPLLDARVSVPEAIVRVLEEAGVGAVFGMSGGNTGRIFAALADHRASIRTVLVRHEALATSAAESYARVSGRPGVAIGQGSWLLGHGVVGTLEALLAGTPLVLLSDLSDGSPFSHHAPYQSGTGEYGSWDARRAFGGITKFVMEPHEAVQAVQSTQLAFKHARAGQPGPVALLFHSASLTGEVGPESVPRLYATDPYLAASVPAVPDMSSVAQALRDAERPVLLAGGGVRSAGAQRELQKVALLSAAPVVTTAAGKGCFAEDHALAAGVFGNFGAPLANDVLAHADTVLVIGSKLGPSDTANEHPNLLDPARQRIMQIDVEPRNASWTFPADAVVIADAQTALAALAADLGDRRVDRTTLERRRTALAGLRKTCQTASHADSDAAPLHPQRVIADLRRVLPDGAIVSADAGENRLLMCRYFETRHPGVYLQSAAAGGMGYAIPAALGAKVCHADRVVVAVCGDGGLGMSLAGLLSAVEERIPITVVVLNNRALGWSMHGQRDRREPEFKTALGDFNYAEIATAIGAEGFRVRTPDELVPALQRATTSGKVAVVDVETSMAETFVDLRSPLMTAATRTISTAPTPKP
ncbi:MAG TPA: thiamine pyrophosphate-binding protein [bacterium]|nr:thiamine pyrophosphate-binding protein [bacterium]